MMIYVDFVIHLNQTNFTTGSTLNDFKNQNINQWSKGKKQIRNKETDIFQPGKG